MNSAVSFYTSKAYQRLDVAAEDWQPLLGFGSCEAILEKLYGYYRAIYLLEPNFYWAGLARLTGGQVLYGMRNLVKIAKDPCVMTQEIMATAKDIFESLAWQHEMFLDCPHVLLQCCQQLDAVETHSHPYYDCWKLVLGGDPVSVAKGNEMLLRNEQCNTIQKHYDRIKADRYSARYFWFTRFVMRRIHPHHNRFILQYPFGDVTQFEDRWKWISNPKGMWPTWVALPQAERDRLVSLSNDAIKYHRW